MKRLRRKISLLKSKTEEWHWATLAIIFFSTIWVSGCASADKKDQGYDSASATGAGNANTAANIGDRFNVGAPRTTHAKGAPASAFFFEDCQDSGDPTYYSKTTYHCN